ncbi:potassium channel protein [Thermodesulfovibrio sp. 1176]|uniref:potassium channel family protein n=2 Tax=unclassified Thermodesulfovibrio TaxID=2645936 RepID=UPI0009F72202|nr:potassium channel protein [Thermodesulfovibrio sp. N1]MDI1471495.1 potassium channel protein [Thermodesulfovibrio sp. 1176]
MLHIFSITFMSLIRKKIFLIPFLLFFILLAGTIGYMYLEEMQFLDALYMTVITLATVGFREVKDLSEIGKIFTIILILSGFGIFTYALTVGARIIIEGEIKEVFKKRKMEKRLENFSEHYIVCGYGRMGSIIVKELLVYNLPLVIIEKNKSNLPENEGIVYIEGDATSDDVLKKAGVQRAKALITVLPSDAENLYVVLSARALNENLFIVARAVEKEAEAKLIRAGANRVVSPYLIGGLRIAHTVLRPTVVDFLEFATSADYLEIQIEEVEVLKGSPLIGKTIAQSGLGKDLEVIIVGIKRADGKMKFNPTSQTIIKEGDTLIVLGKTDKLIMLEKIAQGK